MKRLAIALIFGSATASGWPQKSGTDPAASRKYVETPAIRDGRLQILADERARTQTKLLAALEALPKASDQKEAVEAVTRLQADLQALDREISRMESQHPTAAQVTRKPTASATGEASQDSEKSDATFEPWDVFKNFGKKANTQ